MYQPSLSIITPSYEQARYLEDTIQSVHSQAYTNVEHIVVDGGSEDGTIELLEQYEDEYDLRWVSEADDGQSDAINKGIEMAKGEWIGWQNSDDYYLSGAFETFAETLSNHRDADVIYGDLQIVDEDGVPINAAYFTSPSKFLQRCDHNLLANQSAFFHSSVFEQLGGLNEEYEYCMDIDLFWRLLWSELDLIHIPEQIGCLRVHEEAKTSGSRTPAARSELERIRSNYPTKFYENYLPQPVLRIMGFISKSMKLLRTGRTEAFYQHPKNII